MSQQINLFNPIFLKQKKYFSAYTMVQALGLILVGSLALSAYTGYQVSRLNQEVIASNAQVAAVQAQLTQLKGRATVREKSKALEEEVRKAEAEAKSLQQAFDVLKSGEFGNTKGYSEYMKAFSRQIVGGLWLTGFSITGAGTEIILKGRALQGEMVPAYISRLGNEEIMRGKSFSALEMQAPKEEPAESSPVAGNGAQAVPAIKKPAGYIEFTLQSGRQSVNSSTSREQ